MVPEYSLTEYGWRKWRGGYRSLIHSRNVGVVSWYLAIYPPYVRTNNQPMKEPSRRTTSRGWPMMTETKKRHMPH